MHIYHLRCEMLTRTPIDKTFSVFEDPYNLAKITPPWLNFQVTSAHHVVMRKGAEIDYKISWLGIPMHWKTIILDYQPPVLFVDDQAKGPYQLWRHHHTFKETEEGTLVGDHVEYALPLGPLGELAHALAVRRQLLGIFNFRQEQLGKLLGGVETRQLVKPYAS